MSPNSLQIPPDFNNPPISHDHWHEPPSCHNALFQSLQRSLALKAALRCRSLGVKRLAAMAWSTRLAALERFAERRAHKTWNHNATREAKKGEENRTNDLLNSWNSLKPYYGLKTIVAVAANTIWHCYKRKRERERERDTSTRAVQYRDVLDKSDRQIENVRRLRYLSVSAVGWLYPSDLCCQLRSLPPWAKNRTNPLLPFSWNGRMSGELGVLAPFEEDVINTFQKKTCKNQKPLENCRKNDKTV